MKKLRLFYLLTFVISQMTLAQNYGWTDISANIPTEANLSDVFFVSDNEGWITSSSYAEIYHTTDGGETFEVHTTDYTCNSIHMLNETTGYAGRKSGFIYKTSDGGKNWIFYGTMATTLADISFPPTGEIGSSWVIEHTSNGGIDWTIQHIGDLYEPAFTGIHFTSSTNGYVVGSGRTLFKYTEVSGVGEIKALQFEIYPNPASSVVSLQSAVISHQSSDIEIYDLNGRKLIRKNMPVGSESVEIDVGGLQSGVYFV